MRSTERGTRNAERGTEARPAVPRSDFRVPRWSVGVLLLALLPPPAGAQDPDSTLQDTAALAPVVVTGVRLPTVRERGGASREAERPLAYGGEPDAPPRSTSKPSTRA